MPAREDKIVDQMLNRDRFSQWLGIEVLEIGEGSCKLRMKIRPEMLNGFDIAHGGITYSFADSAFAFASNSRGTQSVSIETSINHVLALKEGDVIHATATEEATTRKTGVYRIVIEKSSGETVAVFKGLVYRTHREWEV